MVSKEEQPIKSKIHQGTLAALSCSSDKKELVNWI